MSKKGLFIVFEGQEGAGKTSQASRLVKSLHERGRRDAIQVREPGGTRIGETIRTILLDVANTGMHPLTEFFLFLASRVKFVEDIVKPKVEQGHIVVADRFALSTMAYQIHARGLPEGPCMTAINLAVQDSHPDVYILLTVTPERGRHRQEKQGKKADRLESENLDFHRKVNEGYRYFGSKVANCHVIDTDDLTEDQVHEKVLEYLQRKFPEHMLV